MSSVHMNEGIYSSPFSTKHTCTHNNKYFPFRNWQDNKKSLWFLFFFHMDRINSRDLAEFSRLTFYGKYCLHNKHILSNYFICNVGNFHLIIYNHSKHVRFVRCGIKATRGPQTLYLFFLGSVADVWVHDQEILILY